MTVLPAFGAGTTPTAALRLSTTSLSFGNVSVGNAVTLSVTATSTGTAPVTVNSVAISGTGFSLLGASFPFTLNPGQSVIGKIQFKPTKAGADTAQLTISASAPTPILALSGTGTGATPALSLSAMSLSFGNVSLGTAVTLSVTATSTGTAPVTVNSAAISGTGFSLLGMKFPFTLNPGQAVVGTIQFNPTSAGADTGQLTISANAPTPVIVLSGIGTSGTPTVSAMTCSSTSITGSLADSCTVSLSGAAPTGGLSVKLTSSNAAVTVPSSVTVPATARSAAFTTQVAAVTKTQAVSLTATTGSSSKAVSLQLNSANAVLTVSAASLSFGAVVLNDSKTESVTLTSSGTAPVTVKSVAVTGSGFSGSTVSVPVTLNPGQTLTVTLMFDPKVAGAATGQLAITTNAPTNSTVAVALSGTGDTHQVELTWTAPVESNVPITGYKVYRSPGGASSFALLNSVSEKTSYADANVISGESYSYYVTSVDSAGAESVPSSTTTVAIP